MPARHALLIGINRYPNIPKADLRGAVNDAELMRSLLVDRFGFSAERVRTLCDAEATQAGIRGALAELAAAVGDEDVVVLFYSGHGSRMIDPRGRGSMVESMVPHDSGRGTHPNLDILDEEIDRWVQAVNEKTPHVTLIFDCCHSGAVTRDAFGEATREAPVDLRAPAEMFGGGPLPEIFTGAAPSGEDKGTAGWLPGRRRAVVIAACYAEELANEHKAFTGKAVVRGGALTFFLGQALLRAQPGATWRDVFEQTAPKVTAKYARQHPQLEGRIDDLLFGTGEVRPAGYLEVLATGAGTVELGGGAAHGLLPGSLWTLRSPGSRTAADGEELAVVEVETVRTAGSTARIVTARDSAQLAAGLRAFLKKPRLSAPGLRVAIAAPEEPRRRLTDALAGEPRLELVEDGEEAEVLIRRREEDATWTAVGIDGRFAVRLRPDRPEEIRGLVEDLASVSRYRQFLDLDNPDPASRLRGRVSLRARRWDPDRNDFVDAAPEPGLGMAVFREGEKAEFEITNGHDTSVWVTLVEFGCDYRIALLLPRRGHSTYARGGLRLEPGQMLRLASEYYRQDLRFAESVREGLPLRLPKGFPWAAEPGEAMDLGLITLRLWVTLESADFEFLEQRAPRPSIAPETDWTVVTLPVGVRR